MHKFLSEHAYVDHVSGFDPNYIDGRFVVALVVVALALWIFKSVRSL